MDAYTKGLGNTQLSHTKCLQLQAPLLTFLGVLQVGLMEVLVAVKKGVVTRVLGLLHFCWASIYGCKRDPQVKVTFSRTAPIIQTKDQRYDLYIQFKKITQNTLLQIYNHNQTSRSKIGIFSTLNFVHPLLSITQTPL